MQPTVIMITGAMAAGKSTVAQLLAERLPRAAHVRGDVFRRMIVSGRAEMTPSPADEATEQLWLRYRLAAQAADGYARAGFTAVLQDVVLGPDLPRYADLVTTRPRHLVVLAPSAATLAAREQARAKKGYGDWTPQALDDALRRDTPRLGLWLDTSDQTPAETVDELLARLPEAELPGVTPSRSAEAEGVISAVRSWAAGHADVLGVVVVGSWARGAATMTSDIDIVVLTDNPRHADPEVWLDVLGGRLIRRQQWGPLSETRVQRPSGLEVEMGVAPTSWASTTPVDAGTYRVINDGHRVIHDPRGILAALSATCR